MNQPPKKRRFSFSLRTLMVFMLALCLLFGFIGMRLQRAREQQAYLEELREAGWSYTFAIFIDSEPNLWDFMFNSNYLNDIQNVSIFPMDDGRSHNFMVPPPLEELESRYVTPNLTLLAELKNLGSLVVNHPQISDLSPLAELMNLRSLDISYTQVSDLSPLSELKNIESLDVSNTNVKNVMLLAELGSLHYLDVSNTQVSDLTPLTKLKHLHWLNVAISNVTDLTPLAKLKKLEILDISNTQVLDLTPLTKLKNLEEIDISNTQVTDEQIQQLQKALPDCRIKH